MDGKGLIVPDVTIEVTPLSTAADFFPLIWDGSWKSLPVEQQKVLVTAFTKAYKNMSLLRGKLDEAIWEGHDDGSVDPSIKSVRARRTGDPGGAPKKVKTMFDILDLEVGE